MKPKRNDYSEDGRCKLCGSVDSWSHYASCSHVGLSERREMLIGNLKSKMGKLRVNSFFTYWLLETLRGVTPRLEKVTPLRLEIQV